MKWVYDLKIATKPIVAFALVAVVAGAIGLIGTLSIRNIDRADTRLYEQMTVPIGELVIVAESFQKIQSDLRGLLLTDDVVESERLRQSSETQVGEIDRAIAAYEATLTTEAGRKRLEAFKEARLAFQPFQDQVVELASQDL